MKKISLVIPMYYEEQVAEECYKRVSKVMQGLKDYDYEIIFINDGSKDKTLEILEKIASKDKNVKVVSFSRNFGHQAAVTCRFKLCNRRCNSYNGCRPSRSTRINTGHA